jgi:uncharacterized protein YecT (DUF1311 family)
MASDADSGDIAVMRGNLRIVILAAALLAPSVGGAAAQNAPLYPVKDCSQLTTQMELNQCAGANDQAADAALNKVYQQVMADQTDAAAKARLTDAERAWIAYRDKECAFEVGPQQDGGSIWPMEMSNCLEAVTAARLSALTKLRSCTAGVSACNPQ